jgi:hypothetical protein
VVYVGLVAEPVQFREPYRVSFGRGNDEQHSGRPRGTSGSKDRQSGDVTDVGRRG